MIVVDYAVVFVLAVLAGGWAIPAGVAFELAPFGVWLTTSVGSSAGLTLMVHLGGRGRDVLASRLGVRPKETAANPRASELARRWGVGGLAVFGTLVLGPTVTTVTALALDIDRRRFTAWSIAVTFGLYAVLTPLWVAVL